MASTDQVREWYRETVSNHDHRGQPGFAPDCNWTIAKVVSFPRAGGAYREPVHPAAEEAFLAYAMIMESMGVMMPSAGGVNQCRNIAGSDWPSLHAYLVAIDLPPNSYKPQAFQDAILDIRTKGGVRVFRNLDGDRMHDQIDCPPSALAEGIDWSTVEGADMAISRGSKADDGIPSLRDNYDRMVELGVFSEHTQPGGVTFNDELATFLVRFAQAIAPEAGITRPEVEDMIRGSRLQPPSA